MCSITGYLLAWQLLALYSLTYTRASIFQKYIIILWQIRDTVYHCYLLLDFGWVQVIRYNFLLKTSSYRYALQSFRNWRQSGETNLRPDVCNRDTYCLCVDVRCLTQPHCNLGSCASRSLRPRQRRVWSDDLIRRPVLSLSPSVVASTRSL